MLPGSLEPQIDVGFFVCHAKTRERILDWPAEKAFDLIAELIGTYGAGAKAEFMSLLERWKRTV